MQTTSLQLLRTTGALTAGLLALSSARVLAADNPDAFPAFDSYIKISGQSASISGNESAFQARSGQPKQEGGGIEELHYSKDFTKDVAAQVDGRALAGAEDYLLHLNIAKNDVGSFDAGYKSFRTFYDGVGGFFPNNSAWTPLAAQDLHVDRGQFWAEAKIALPNQPEYTLRYTNETRDGMKDSTIWGDMSVAGSVGAGSSTTRKIVPAYLQLDERHQAFEGTMKQTLGDTTYQIRLLGDWVNNLDSRHMTLNPGIPAESDITATDGNGTKTAGIMANTSTDFGSKLTLRTGLRFQNVDDKFTGTRPKVSGTGVTTYDYFDLVGNSNAKISTGLLALDFKPAESLMFNAGFSAEHRDAKSAADYMSGTPALPSPRHEYSRSSENSVTPELGVNYTGIRTVALYASASRRFATGNENYATGYNPITFPAGAPATALFSDSPKEDHGDYKIGANWRQSSVLTVRCEFFYKDHGYKAAGVAPVATLPPGANGSYYVLGSQFKGVTLSTIFKPIDPLTFTTRYTYQKGVMQVTGSNLSEYDSMDMTVHNISETIDWTPIQQFYMQASGNVVFNVISTVYPRAGTTISDTVLQNSNNNYVTGSVLAGAVLTKRDDLHVLFTYYRAFDSNQDLADYSMPYGVSVREVSVSVGIIHKLNDHLIASGKLGYFDASNETTGGHTNFHGPLGYVSLEYGL